MCQNGVLSQGLPALPPLSMPLFLTLSLALLGVAVSCIFLCHFLVGSAVCHLTCCCMQIKCLPQHKVDFCPKLTARWRLLSVQNKKKKKYKLSASLRTHNGSWQCRTPGNAGARVSLLINKCIAIARNLPPHSSPHRSSPHCCGKFKSTFVAFFMLCSFAKAARCIKLLSKNLFVVLTHAITINK